jgi:hypothetical protein
LIDFQFHPKTSLYSKLCNLIENWSRYGLVQMFRAYLLV